MMWSAALWTLLSATIAAGHLAGLQSNVGDNAIISFPAPNIDYMLHDVDAHIFGRANTPECGINSEGQKSCPLNLCCSKSGKCGIDPSFCNDCQKEWGSCAVPPTPKCGTGSTSASKGRHVAYYQVADSRRRKCDKKSPSQLNTTGITHLNLAFAIFDPSTFELRPENQADLAIYSEFIGLKSPTLQTWIAVGGWAFSEPGPTRKTWSKMASSQENRAKFITSAIDFMDQHGFQGIDLSWEFPSAVDRGGDSSHDAANMVSLAVELRNTIGTRFGFSIALPSSYNYLHGIDPYALQTQVDWFNSMTYDLHGVWDGEPGRDGAGAKVKPHTDLREIDANLQLLWFNKIDPAKVNLGLAYYSRAYTLADKNCNHMNCDFSGPSKKGECSQFEGYLMNSEISNIIKNRNLQTFIINGAAVKQVVWDDQWAAYDDWETLAMKVGYANELCLGGTFIWSLDYAAEGGSTPGLGTTSLPSIGVSTSLASISVSITGPVGSSVGQATSVEGGFTPVSSSASGSTNAPGLSPAGSTNASISSTRGSTNASGPSETPGSTTSPGSSVAGSMNAPISSTTGSTNAPGSSNILSSNTSLASSVAGSTNAPGSSPAGSTNAPISSTRGSTNAPGSSNTLVSNTYLASSVAGSTNGHSSSDRGSTNASGSSARSTSVPGSTNVPAGSSARSTDAPSSTNAPTSSSTSIGSVSSPVQSSASKTGGSSIAPGSSNAPGGSSSSAVNVSPSSQTNVTGGSSTASSGGNTVSGRSSAVTGSGSSQASSTFLVPTAPIGTSMSGINAVPIWATGPTTFPITSVLSGTMWIPTPIGPSLAPITTIFSEPSVWPTVALSSTLSGGVWIPIWPPNIPMTSVLSGTVWIPTPIRASSTPVFSSGVTQFTSTAASSRKPKSWPTTPISSTVSGTVTIPVFEPGFPMISTTSNGVVFPVPIPQPTNTMAYPYCCFLGLCDCPTSGATVVPTPTNSVDFELCCLWGLCSLNCPLKNPATSTSAGATNDPLACCFWNLCTGCPALLTGTPTTTVSSWPAPSPTDIDIEKQIKDIDVIIFGLWGRLDVFKRDHITGKQEILDDIDKLGGLFGTLKIKIPGPPNSPAVPDCKPKKPKCGPLQFLCDVAKAVVDLVICLAEDYVKLRSMVISGAIDGIEDLVQNIKDKLAGLDSWDPKTQPPYKTDPNDPAQPSDPAQSSREQSTRSSSTDKSCSATSTVYRTYVSCRATPVSTNARLTTQSCSTSTSTIAGCDVTGGATITVSMATCSPSTVYQRLVSCFATPVPTNFGSTTQTCATAISTIFGCDVTGTATASTSSAPACTKASLSLDDDEGDDEGAPPTSDQLCSYSACTSCDGTATATAAPTDVNGPKRSLVKRRPLPNPKDPPWNGDVAQFIDYYHLWGTSIPGSEGTQYLTEQLGNTRKTFSVLQIVGCTAVIVVSRKRVWMVHFFESPSFVHPWDSQSFRDEVLTPLEFGGGDSGVPQSNGLAHYASAGGDFENTLDNPVHVTILTPRPRDNPNAVMPEYINHVSAIHDLLYRVFDFDRIIGTMDIALYNVRMPDFTVDIWPWGKAVVVYDPFHGLGAGGCGILAAKEIWFEDSPQPRYHDEWFAYVNQLGAQWRRDASASASACSFSLFSTLSMSNSASSSTSTMTSLTAQTSSQKPNSTTPAPSSSQKHSSTTPAPSSSQKPSSTTPVPSSSQKPSSMTPASSSSQKPSSTTSPSSSSQKPSSTTPAPSSSQKPSSTTPAPSSSQKPSSTTPTPTLAPIPKPPITGRWRIRFHQQMDHENSWLWWILVDSNGEDAGNGQGAPIMAHPNRNELPYEVDVDVFNPKNKETTNIHLTQSRTNGQCQPTWKMGAWGTDGRGDAKAKPWTKTCEEGPAAQELGCDMPTSIRWVPWNGGFERFFECWFLMLPRSGSNGEMGALGNGAMIGNLTGAIANVSESSFALGG